MECACATFRTKKKQRSAYKILPSSRERATPSLRMGNHALVARPRVLTCPPPGAHCPHTPRIHHAAARPASVRPKPSWPPKHASPRRFVCTKPHTRDSPKSMGWRMVAHHALHAGNGQTSGSWPDQQVLAPQPCMGAAPNPRTPPSKGLQTLSFYCQCPDNTASGLTTTPVSIPAPSRQPSPVHTPSATRLALTGLRRACARCAGRPLSAQSLRNAARCVVLNVGA